MIRSVAIVNDEGAAVATARFDGKADDKVTTSIAGTEEGLKAVYFYLFDPDPIAPALAVTVGFTETDPSNAHHIVAWFRVAADDFGYTVEVTKGGPD